MSEKTVEEPGVNLSLLCERLRKLGFDAKHRLYAGRLEVIHVQEPNDGMTSMSWCPETEPEHAQLAFFLLDLMERQGLIYSFDMPVPGYEDKYRCRVLHLELDVSKDGFGKNRTEAIASAFMAACEAGLVKEEE